MRRLVTVVCIGLIILGTVVGAMANSESEALVAEGRELVFNNGNPTYQGIVESRAKFQDAFNADSNDQTARLFLAASKLAVFGLENGDNPATLQTFRDLYEAFGISRTTAESIWESPLSDPPTVFDEYDPPETMPNGDQLQLFLAGPFLDLIDEVIPLVNGIDNDTEFIVVLTPEELGDPTSLGIEIDYGDVLLLRSFLYTLKAFILLIDSYDMDGLDIQEVAVLINADVMQLQRDIFDRYTDFFNLKTPNSLSESKTALLLAIDTWQAAYEFIDGETDPQEDDLFAFGSEEEREDAERTLNRILDFKASIVNNQPMDFVTREIEWVLTNPSGDMLGVEIEIEQNGKIDGHAWGINNCNFLFCGGGVNQYVIEGNQITIELETDQWCDDTHWEILTATLTGTLNEDGDQIINGTYLKPDCSSGESTGPFTFTGSKTKDETETVKMDFNRVFGNTDKPAVNIHDVLPQFDADDEPVPDSFSEPVLGGFFPDVTTNDQATMFFELQPSGLFEIPNNTIAVDGDMSDWTSIDPLHADISGDNDTDLTGSDIEKVYLAKDDTYLYVGMTLHGGDPNPAVIYGIGFRNWADDGYMPLKMFAAYDTNSSKWIAGLEQWGGVVFADFDGAAEGTNCIEWRIPLSEIEIPSRLDNGSLSGKFVSTATVLAATGDELDFNETRIQLDPATLTGNFTCPDYDGNGKIFIRVVGEDDPRSEWEFGSTWVEGSTGGTYTINGLSAGQEVHVYAIWDKDDNGVITYPDYLWGTESPLTIQPGTNNLDITITDNILDTFGQYNVTGSIMNVHQPDGSFETYFSVWMDDFVFGDLCDGVTDIVVKDPDGTIVLTRDDFECDGYDSDGTEGEFFAIVSGEPLLGTYTFEVSAGGLQAEPVTDTQDANVSIPVPDISSFVPADGAIVDSMTPIFSWDAVDFENACYRLTIDDEWGNRVHSTSRVPGMLSAVVPQGILQPGQTYYWRIRVTDADNWLDVQNRANSDWISFTMADIGLGHDASPAIDLDGYGVATWSNEDGIMGLDFSVKVIDHDGILNNSHVVTVTFPDGHSEDMDFNSSQSATTAFYYYWAGLDSTQLADLQNSNRTFTFTVTDPAGNQGEATDLLIVNPLDAPDDRRFSITPNGTTPTFTWDNTVAGANTYRVRIYTDDLTRTVYRESLGNVGQHTVPPGILGPNTTYRYRIEARDSHFGIDIDNVSKAPANNNENIQFTTGSEASAPYIDCITSGVETWNHPDAGHIPSFWIKVHDAQGVPGNIKSVKVRFPDYATSGKEALLSFDYNESGTCGVYQGESFLGVQSGIYTFVVEDNDGHVTEKTELLDVNCLTPPVDWTLDITPEAAGDGTGFHFVWDPVETGFEGFYRLEIYDRNYNQIYRLATLDNQYDLPPGFLKKQELYRFRVTARREFFDENVDNGASMPWAFDDFPTRVAVPLTGGSALPSIALDSWGAVVYHYPDPTTGNSKYRLAFSAKISDADGVPENIQSVTVSDGTTTWDLNYDSKVNETEAYYWLWFEIADPAGFDEKIFTFTVTDADVNSAETGDTLIVNVLEIPEGLKPVDGSSFYGTCPVIEWDPVDGAAIYRVRIYDGLYDTLHKGGYVEQPAYMVPPGVLELNQIFSYRIRACREDFRQEGVDLDNLSCSELLATGIQPHVTTRELDLGGSILTLQTVAGMAPEGINASADVNNDAKIGTAEAVYGMQKEAGLR